MWQSFHKPPTCVRLALIILWLNRNSHSVLFLRLSLFQLSLLSSLLLASTSKPFCCGEQRSRATYSYVYLRPTSSSSSVADPSDRKLQFGHGEETTTHSGGSRDVVAEGSYSVRMPDGRTQVHKKTQSKIITLWSLSVCRQPEKVTAYNEIISLQCAHLVVSCDAYGAPLAGERINWKSKRRQRARALQLFLVPRWSFPPSLSPLPFPPSFVFVPYIVCIVK